MYHLDNSVRFERRLVDAVDVLEIKKNEGKSTSPRGTHIGLREVEQDGSKYVEFNTDEILR